MLEKGSVFLTKITRKEVFRGLVIFVLLAVGLFALNVPASWAQLSSSAESVQNVGAAVGMDEGAMDLPTLIGRIINIVLGVVGIILLGYLLFAGYIWMTAGGDPKKVDEAKGMIKNAVIGLVIIVASFAIATFIINMLIGATGEGGISGTGPGGAGGGFPGSAGSLGGGIIEYHVPMRDAKDIPRNTAIVITFKEPIKLASFIQDYNDNGTPANLADDPASSTTIGLNATNIKIFPTNQAARVLKTADARVRFTADRKTFVIKPVNYLGSATENTGYSIELAGGRSGILREDGGAAFGGSFGGGYKWQFEVSTQIDNTPPRITSVIPSAGGLYAPNIIVQVNFNEAVDPTSASGVYTKGAGFPNTEIESQVRTGKPGTVSGNI